ncbi:MAG: DAK2 domain-containing protein, partial [Clostridia bacterium]|nr:DAK2 domain-containing protein [Clostridia bacterium]
AMANVSSGAVTHAVRSTNIDGFDLKEGEIIGLSGGKIVAKDADINTATIALVDAMMSEDKVNVTIFSGDDIKDEDAEKLQEQLAQKYPECEVTVIPGGQPVYYYLISLE